MTSSPHGPYGLGYTRATIVKVESLVIAHQHGAVNTFPGLVHTARHTMGIGSTLRWCANLARGGSQPR